MPDPAISLYITDMLTQWAQIQCLRMFTAALFVITKKWDCSKCPTIREVNGYIQH